MLHVRPLEDGPHADVLGAVDDLPGAPPALPLVGLRLDLLQIHPQRREALGLGQADRVEQLYADEADAFLRDYAGTNHREYFADYFVSLNQNLFVPVVYMALDGTTMTWELSYDPKQEPEMVDRLPVYSLYLRGVMSETSSETDEEEEEKPEEPKTFSDVVVFDMSAFLSDIKAHGAPSSGIQVRIRFLEGEDSSRPSGLLWGMTDPLLIN